MEGLESDTEEYGYDLAQINLRTIFPEKNESISKHMGEHQYIDIQPQNPEDAIDSEYLDFLRELQSTKKQLADTTKALTKLLQQIGTATEQTDVLQRMADKYYVAKN